MNSVIGPMPSGGWSPAVLAEEVGVVPGFGIYIHWPFCLSKCPYCDFNSHVARGIDQERWRAAYRRELAAAAAHGPSRPVTSVFFGGGTPSLMEPATVAAVLDAIAAHWPLAADLEVTLEANPTSVEAGRFDTLRAVGVNRLSLGVQALDDTALAALGRGHSVAEALAAVALATARFERVSLDLIYARPGQSVASWRTELAAAVALGCGHLSAYQLTIEPGTAFHPRARRGELALPDEDTAAELYEATQECLEAAGLPAYEISNHARLGQECRHNLIYWRGGDFVGIGPGAHGRRCGADGGRWATCNHRDPAVWLAQVESRGHGGAPPEAIGSEERLLELLMMGLRLTEGVACATVRREFGREVSDLLRPDALARLIGGGFLRLSPERLVATPVGRQRLNAVLAALV